jgi:hypothetical protein
MVAFLIFLNALGFRNVRNEKTEHGLNPARQAVAE